ncbi:MAG: family 10 glycosylhydrolase [Calditrichaeota bacterium]|nr:family 10 glycosylhydrolase [Calditrichota bacterium]
MKRRNFLFSLAGLLVTKTLFPAELIKANDFKIWVWMHPGCRFDNDDWKYHLDLLNSLGIRQILIQVYTGSTAHFASNLPTRVPCDILEQVLPLAKERNIKVHAWIWTMMNGSEKMMKKHPDWYVVNRLGKSTVEEPPYVSYYRWLCPSKPEVHEYLKQLMRELSAYNDLAGIHLDYIRFPDVILPEGIQPKYNLKQESEMPQFDYCYCDTCRRTYKDQTGIDPLNLKSPDKEESWLKFRQDQITNVVNLLSAEIKRQKKIVSAAVFATPDLAKRYVRQNWGEWNIDLVFPMIYHKFYDKPLEWIYTATREGTAVLPSDKPLYSGLFLSDIKPDELKTAFNYARKGGAKGVSLFSYGNLTGNGDYLKALKS